MTLRVTELGNKHTSLWVARGIVLVAAAAACVSQTGFYIFLAIYGVGFIGYSLQRRVLFWPTRKSYRSPIELGATGVSELWLNSPDGELLLTWQAKPQPGMPTILYCHGNHCNLSNRLERISRFTRDGYGVLMLSFRGYGLSTGRPSEKNNVNDALLAYHFLRKSGVNPADIVVYGESLGTGVAVQVAARRPVAALVMEAPYTTLMDLVRYRIKWLPAYMFLKDKFESIRHIKNVTAPLLVVHSLGDNVIPIAFGHWFFAAAPGEKKFLRVRGAGHYGLFRVGAWPKIRQFIEEHVPGAAVFGEQARENVQISRSQTRQRTERLAVGAAQMRHRFAN